MPEPTTTQAILVGIEKYADSNAIPNLNGPVNDVYQFCQWLRDRNVPPENISVFLSPLDRNVGIVDKITNLVVSEPLKATRDVVNQALREEARRKTASLFFLFWSGHGWIASQGDRRLIYADATIENLKNLNLTAQLNAMQTDLYNNLPRQLLIFDACANSTLLKITPPDDLPAIGKHLPSQKQMAMFAANPGEYAINKSDEQTGIFSRELLSELRSLKDTEVWPPDMEVVMRNVQEKFIKLREDGQTKQTPSFFLYQDWTGNRKERFSEIELATKPRERDSFQLPRNLTSQELGLLRDLFLQCQSIQDPQSRKDIILNLRKEIANNIIMEGNANTVLLSAIKTSRGYSGGLAELLDVIDMLYENDSVAMQNLRRTAIQMLPEEFD
ncbi:MAG: caspase family protein [Microcystis panniformis Mp_MB_F_20051200_S9]|uniref:Caspase family protein n=1 Tax=Microcystis panniformis Mp_MB_F_20051200_S9 TaxID=2486223 RepID=A0A552Q680_9CHRO|nr:MAG: caspase family protein [Microcystis panniformis Mp_MB_F_20080800_S26D]TRV51099.1 MAG: caspase family protein [Microcystis panniformis Mp_GB_SS_20050300_S99]TRV56050.1 MAG: caspase family protein [Microcystis panniformis Mp_GB_SS_20050300_S99D]TRV56800.1 MAG: caspase family protein [Microcystis panniformis Mp_MB_F_20080800_S26]TRV64730.1 MAG: caspase family protein [Microcystis panniformis Mp_MB_F_20051200_S9]TRV68278.1 MAG: caspase family protein [Microcystis panniformis Mp_MB_F_200512